MKKMKKFFALLIAMAMVLGMSINVFAAPDTVPAANTGTITINNAGIGETYNVYKVLDASVGANGAIVYPGPVPSGLDDCFEIGSDGVNLKVKAGLSEKDLFDKLKTWADGATATASPITATTSTVKFTNLPFGYYVVTSTMDDGAVISVTSTNPDAVTYEKNSTIPQPVKEADDTSYSIGQTITYTVSFSGANYMQPEGDTTGKNAEIVVKYEVKDTLPEFLSDAKVTKVTVAGNDITSSLNVSAFATAKKFDIPWADKDDEGVYTSKYANGATVEITYTAKLTSTVNVNEDNTNTVTITPYVDSGDGPEPWEEHWDADDVITTYAAALKKTDGTKELAGAKFKFYGLEVEKTADGVYTVKSYDPAAYDTSEGATQDESKLGTEMEVDANGKLYIIGLKEGVTLKGIETVAPAGYNLLTTEVTLTPQVLETEVYKESGTRYYDAAGNLVAEEASSTTSKEVEKNLEQLDAAAVEVVNNPGTVLPSTGGIGTTIFYIVGAVLVIGAGVVLVTRRRLDAQ